MSTAHFTEEDRAEVLAALTDLQPLRQAIGRLGPMLRRTKSGSKKHRQYWDELTRMENEAGELSSKIRMFLRLVELP